MPAPRCVRRAGESTAAVRVRRRVLGFMKVSFLIGGTEPAGTNQLAHLLGRHPEVCMPVALQPEPNFFSKDAEYVQGSAYYEARYFAHCRDQRCVGEKSGRYLWHPHAAQRIHAYNPDMRMIFILRAPADRAYSNYRFNCLNGIEPLSFDRALGAEARRCSGMRDDAFWKDIQPYAYFDKGLYARQLGRYLEHFAADRIHVLTNEALRDDAMGAVRRVLAFLGLSSTDYRDAEDAPAYTSFHVRSRRIQRLIRRTRRPLLERAIMAKRSGVRPTMAERLVQMNFTAKRTAPDAGVVARLNDRYADELAAVQRMTGINLTPRS